ncbi:FadR/GntR family transcriptional regulator [Jannaschia pohangensis]|uniref:Transcriptional regulator, GntR family n=1 Tax=Jannaschia pohangensis TaxID=390807 RepID=A0A1I3T9L7_9RHOB|nr:FadR/GntR family transcriptional regulator [Jannaschia pohangensis]SFJ67655.1 transcriptional regulator, GntR family [Jannaschia pohangensis]
MTQSLRQSITQLIEAELPPDGRLPTERALAERFDTSRRVVRQVLDQLETEGLVWRRQGSGTYAGQPEDPTGDLAARIAGETDPIQVMEARLCIEPELAALCATRMTDEELARLRTLAHRHVAADAQTIELWDGAFHRLIAQCARNRPLLTAFALLDRIRSNPDWVQVRARARSRTSLTVPQSEHEVLIDAIAARNPDAARQAMHDHLSARFTALKTEFTDGLREAGE